MIDDESKLEYQSKILNQQKLKICLVIFILIWLVISDLKCDIFQLEYLVGIPVCQLILWGIILGTEIQDYKYYKQLQDTRTVCAFGFNHERGKCFYVLYFFATSFFLVHIVSEVYLVIDIIPYYDNNSTLNDEAAHLADCFYYGIKLAWFEYFLSIFSILINSYFFASITYILYHFIRLNYERKMIEMQEKKMIRASHTLTKSLEIMKQKKNIGVDRLRDGLLGLDIESESTCNRKISIQATPESSCSNIIEAWQEYQEVDKLCVICQQQLLGLRTIQTRCGHLFHRDCFGSILKNGASCPICRFHFNSE